MNQPPTSTDDGDQLDGVRARIVAAATELIAAGGRDAATTRAVATAAGVQAPTIYRLFGDKRGLLMAVAEHGFAAYIAQKTARVADPDPVRELRHGWDRHVQFGLAHPGLFAILSTDPELRTPSVAAGRDLLLRKIGAVARAGRLRVSEERALALMQSMCLGTVLTMLAQPVARRDVALSAVACESVLATITIDAGVADDPGPGVAAALLRASLDRTSVLSAGERLLIEELLVRIADGDARTV